MTHRRLAKRACLAGLAALAVGLGLGLWHATRLGSPPRPEPTTADLLVGTWRYVKVSGNNEPLPLITIEYRHDGTFHTVVDWGIGPPVTQTGTYRLNGDKVDTEIVSPPAKRRTFQTRIKSIEANRLVQSQDGDRVEVEMERLRDGETEPRPERGPLPPPAGGGSGAM